MAERLGPSFAWWLEAPFALALWSYHQLQDVDRGRRWVARMDRLEAAELMHLAVNKPEALRDERARILALAAGETSVDQLAAIRARGERMARFIRKGKVLES